jgi:hypothetical protein
LELILVATSTFVEAFVTSISEVINGVHTYAAAVRDGGEYVISSSTNQKPRSVIAISGVIILLELKGTANGGGTAGLWRCLGVSPFDVDSV